jgi:hypothetical protein
MLVIHLGAGNPQDSPVSVPGRGVAISRNKEKVTIPRARMIFMNASLPKLEHFNKPISQEG